MDFDFRKLSIEAKYRVLPFHLHVFRWNYHLVTQVSRHFKTQIFTALIMHYRKNSIQHLTEAKSLRQCLSFLWVKPSPPPHLDDTALKWKWWFPGSLHKTPFSLKISSLVTARKSGHGSQAQQTIKCPLHFSLADFVCFPQTCFLRGTSCVILTCPTLLLQQYCHHRHRLTAPPLPCTVRIAPSYLGYTIRFFVFPTYTDPPQTKMPRSAQIWSLAAGTSQQYLLSFYSFNCTLHFSCCCCKN